jgi:hexosaminidase
MNRLPLFATLALSAFIASCSDPESATTPGLVEQAAEVALSASARIAANFAVTQEVLTNFQGVDEDVRAQCKRAGGSGATCSSYRISLINRGPAIAADERDWVLYFHSVRRSLVLTNSDAFTLERVNGDLHRLIPTEKFAGIASGETLALDMLAESWMQFASDF